MDRNRGGDTHANRYYVSLSARRAWIEMEVVVILSQNPAVALRKESVDRNQVCIVARGLFQQSLSARRAWIEIQALTLSAV